jgi:hypothetical protein
MNSSLGEPTGKTGRPSSEEGTLPVLYSHSKAVYEAMLRSSSKQEFKDADGQTKEAVVYEGFLTKLVTEDLHLSVPYYTSVMRALKKMGCVRQVRRGGSSSPSQWQLYFEPTEKLFVEKTKLTNKRSNAQSTRLEQCESNIQALNRRVTTLEAALQNMIKEEEQGVLP